MLSSIALIFFAFITSIFTAIAGMGGGVLLLAILPSLLPLNAIIPVHGFVQLTSNASRFYLSIKDAAIIPIVIFSIGGIIGSALGYSILPYIKINYLPIIVSAFILLILWIPINSLIKNLPGKYFSLGIVQTGLSIFTGAVGPLSTTFLLKDGYEINKTIATNAGMNSIQNVFKIIVFILSGFIFHDYLYILIGMCIASILGSYTGVKLRKFINQNLLIIIIKFLITIVCLWNILNGFL